MVRIRFRRVGAKKQPSYRLVAADKESPRDGRFLEILGFYNPRTNPPSIKLKEDRIFDWMIKGAQPTESVQQVFKTTGLMDRYETFKQGQKVEIPEKEVEVKRAVLVEEIQPVEEIALEKVPTPKKKTTKPKATKTKTTTVKTAPKTKKAAAPAKKKKTTSKK